MKKLIIGILMLSLTIGMLSAQMRATLAHKIEKIENDIPKSTVENHLLPEKGILFGTSSLDERNIQFSHTISNILEDIWIVLESFEAMQRFTPDQIAAFGLSGHNLSKVIFAAGIGTAQTYTIKVYMGGSGGAGNTTLNPGTLVHQQLVTSYTPNTYGGIGSPAIWTEVDLTTEIPIPSDQELWIGYHMVPGSDGQGPPVTDYGNGFDGHGYIIWTPSGGWKNGLLWNGYNENWMIRGLAVMPGSTGTLTGAVTSDGNALADAEVTIADLGITVLTNASGVYTMTDVPVGTYSVTASKLGYMPATNNGVVITGDNATTSNFTLAASSTVAVSGVIKGSDALQGLDGANITLTGITDYATTSNASGSFTIPGVYPGYTYHLRVTRYGYMTYDDPDIEVGTSDLDLGEIMVLEVMNPPRNLVAEIVNHKVELQWLPPDFTKDNVWFSQASDVADANTRAHEGYNVYRTHIVNLENPSQWDWIAENIPIGNNEDEPVFYIDAQFPALDAGQYHYIVKAVYTNGHESTGAISNLITKITDALAPPELLTGSFIYPDQVQLNWISPSSDVIGYRIERDGIVLVANQTATSYLDNGLIEGEYTYQVIAIYDIGESFPAKVVVRIETSEGGDNPVLMTTLKRNYPNPFNPSTTIAFEIKEAGVVQIDIFNIRGQKVKSLVHEHMDIGRYSAVWTGIDDNGHNVSSGMYFYQMRTESFSEIKRMVLMK